MAYKINKDECIGCGSCSSTCPVGCISQDDSGKYEINENDCIECGSCKNVCPVGAPKGPNEN